MSCVMTHELTCFLHSHTAHQRLCFCYISLYFLKPESLSLLPSCLAVHTVFVSDLVGNPKDRYSRDMAPTQVNRLHLLVNELSQDKVQFMVMLHYLVDLGFNVTEIYIQNLLKLHKIDST